MCIVIASARLSNTRIYAGEFEREGETLHTLVYQNRAENLSRGPNCMILPIPSSEVMTRENVIETEDASTFLDDVIEASKPQIRSRGMKGAVLMAGAAGGDPVDVFETGIYTVVLSKSPGKVLSALKEHVPKHKRPTIHARMMLWYNKHYPGWNIALCCFDNEQAASAKPLVWWYKPKFPQVLFAPGVDAHDGNPPDLDAKVDCDHDVVFGSTRGDLTEDRSQGRRPRIELLPKAYGKMEELMPKHGTYKEYYGQHSNADFVMPLEGFYRGLPKLHRGMVLPTGELTARGF